MKQVVPVRSRVKKDIITRVARLLKNQGELNVVAGQEVTPDEIIGSFTLSAGFRTINLASLLSVSPASCEKYLARALGKIIYQGELLACKKGLLGNKNIVSPTDGVLDFLNKKTGELKINFLPKKIKVPAGVYGVVESVDKIRGRAIIRTQVTSIQGVLGSGKSRDGILHILGKNDILVNKPDIKVEHSGLILVGGSLFFRDAISSAVSSGITGLISGGINAQDFKGMSGGKLSFPQKFDNDVGISVVATEGYGSIPLGFDIFSILEQYQGKFAFINGSSAEVLLPYLSSDCLTRIKKTSLPGLIEHNLTQDQVHLREEWELKPGLKVRVTGNSYLGEQGKIISIDQSQTQLASGIKDYLATIETARRKIQVPVANLEIIG